MKKKLILGIAAVVLITVMFAGCTPAGETVTNALMAAPTSAATQVIAPAPTDSAEAMPDVSEPAAEWSVKVGNFDIISSMVGNTVETVTMPLQKVSKDGSMKEQDCVGYKLSDLLALAGVGQFTSMTVIAAAGVEYTLDYATAILDTTLLVIEQNGEAYSIPRFAVNGAGSDAWVKDVVEFRITE